MGWMVMDSSEDEMGEGALMALLDFLVDPLLPFRLPLNQTVTLSQDVMVSRQVHAVVLLYNYHHRKQHPDLPFLDFKSFCKLAVILKPSLQLFFRHMKIADYTKLDDLEKHLSLTEKAIMNACDTSKSLDASNNYPIIEGWPVTKVAVFLVDSRKENCYLFHSSITQGVWSAIEKEVNASSQGSEAVAEAIYPSKKKRVVKKVSKENQTVDGTSLQQLAFLAVKEKCGIKPCDLKILENHLVYSTSKAKTAVRLFIMQCTHTNQDANLIPIKDVLDSMQGPLVSKDSISWISTPVVEYFHLLPFADKVAGCLMREMSQNSSQHIEAAKEDGSCNSFTVQAEQLSDSSYPIEVETENENFPGSPLKEKARLKLPEKNSTIVHVKENPFLNTSEQKCTIPGIKEGPLLKNPESLEATQEVRNGSNNQLKEDIAPSASKYSEPSKAVEAFQDVHSSQINSISSSQHPEEEKVVKNNSSTRRKGEPIEPVVYKRNKGHKNNSSSKYLSSEKTYTPTNNPRQAEIQYMATASSLDTGVFAQETEQTESNEGAIVVILPEEFPVVSSRECDDEKILSDNRISDTATLGQDEKLNHALVCFDSGFKHHQKVQITIASKEKLISQTALNVLIKKREQLSLQVRNIADEIALCERSIQTILSGGEDDLAVKIDSILEGCKEISMRTAGATGDETSLHPEDQDLPPVVKRKRLSEANLCGQSPCQELDGICNANFWMSPTYTLSPLEGGFQAVVTVKGVDFDCSSEGTIHTNPSEARNVAASNMLVKLRSMQAES